MGKPIRIVGCGRWSMGDDRLGLLAAEALARRSPPQCVIRLLESPGSDLLAVLHDDVKLLALIDAAPADEHHPPGSIARMDYRNESEKLAGIGSKGDTHSLSVASALAMGTALNMLPEDVWIYVAFGRRFERDFSETAEARMGLARLVSQVELDVRTWLANHQPVGVSQ